MVATNPSIKDGTMVQSDDQKPSPRFKVTSRRYNGRGASAVDILILIIITAAAWFYSGTVAALIGFVIALIIVARLSIRIISEWNRMAVLRLGKYEGIIGPGLYLIIPIVESTPINVDLRVISTPFAAEKTLTKDNVPVDVDAILFWQVHDPENAILNVQSYYNSVLLASQTAMRDIIGKSELSEMLAGRDIIGKDIQGLIEERIHNWGIDAISVEIRDVKIPVDLQNAMARVATSDREKQARVILAESESLAADKMLEASAKYQTDPYAMQLRALNMMYEISTNGKNLIVFIPTESKGFAMPTPIGIIGIEEAMKRAQAQSQQHADGKKPKHEKE
jgi:regulator of protease activity HflC (stomatin/prohibitin superfamily)